MGQIKVMTPKDGDKHIQWDPDDPKSVEEAEEEFDKLKKKGHKLYRVEQKPSRTGEPVDKFDPSVKEYIAAPPMGGG